MNHLANSQPLTKTTASSAALLRGFDLALACGLLFFLSPILIGLAAYSLLKAGAVFEKQTVLGRNRIPFPLLSFTQVPFGKASPALINIVLGQLAFVGPQPLPDDAEPDRQQEWRFEFRPGWVSPHRLRQRMGIAFEDEALDLEFFRQQSLKRNLGLLIRSLINWALVGNQALPCPPTLNFFGVELTNTTQAEALDWMFQQIDTATPSMVAFMNPDCLNIVYGNQTYRDALALAARILPDGIGVKIGSRILGWSLKANVNGTDLFPPLCERAALAGIPVYLLGAKPGIALATAENMQAKFPSLVIAGVQDGYFKAEDTDSVIEAINTSGAQILLVAFGAPRQEIWLAEHAAQLKPCLRLGVGGLFDYYSGRIARAPLWMREIGMEWIWRILQEPGRLWRRYLIGNPIFLYRVWKQKTSGNPQ